MFLAKVIGHVVATQKDPTMKGRRLLILRPQLVDPVDPTKFKDGGNTVVAIDTLGAGEGETVLFVQGSSARMAENLNRIPVDAAVIGIVDTVDVLGKRIHKSAADTSA